MASAPKGAAPRRRSSPAPQRARAGSDTPRRSRSWCGSTRTRLKPRVCAPAALPPCGPRPPRRVGACVRSRPPAAAPLPAGSRRMDEWADAAVAAPAGGVPPAVEHALADASAALQAGCVPPRSARAPRRRGARVSCMTTCYAAGRGRGARAARDRGARASFARWVGTTRARAHENLRARVPRAPPDARPSARRARRSLQRVHAAACAAAAAALADAVSGRAAAEAEAEALRARLARAEAANSAERAARAQADTRVLEEAEERQRCALTVRRCRRVCRDGPAHVCGARAKAQPTHRMRVGASPLPPDACLPLRARQAARRAGSCSRGRRLRARRLRARRRRSARRGVPRGRVGHRGCGGA
jgi:hypothetical protein